MRGGYGKSDMRPLGNPKASIYVCMYMYVCMYAYVCVCGGGIRKSDVRPLLKFKQTRSLVCRAIGRHQIAPFGAPKVA